MTGAQASNNWLAIRVRNATHNFQYVESFGSQAMKAPAGGAGTGVFKCIQGDFCQRELYHYGAINASEYPHYPVMTDARWCMDNAYAAASGAVKASLHAQLKASYCDSRRLGADRMECVE